MSIWGDELQVLKDDWNGHNAVGDTAKLTMDTADKIPGVGEYLPDGDEAKTVVEKIQGGPGNQSGDGNLGNKIGTVLGAGAGLIGGPGGMALGADIGSAAGGWLANLF